MEVYYNDGAADLVLALEDTDWRRALYIIQKDTIQSYGNFNRNCGNNVWLVIVEGFAIECQAPAWLISPLHSVHPSAAEQTTQFGELPLHLAIEYGASSSSCRYSLAWHHGHRSIRTYTA
ncbi:hypothetical protein ACA910_005557 [Epithemia clementina (nom. ined.)]